MVGGLLAFAIALIASLILTVPVRALALRVGMVDLPGPRKVHLTPIPLLGGLAIYGGIVLAIVLALDGTARAQSTGILAGATLVAVVGILDDRGLLHHQIKLFVGMPVAGGILLASGIHAQMFGVLLGGRTGWLLDVALTLFWVVGITAAYSILDHMDGLCAGAAALGLKLRLEHANHAAAWLVPVLILGVPVFDTSLVTISRLRRGLLPFAAPGTDHAAHRLANLGLSQRGAVLAMYALGAVSGGTAIFVSYLSARGALLAASVATALLLAGVVLLECAPYERQVAKAEIAA